MARRRILQLHHQQRQEPFVSAGFVFTDDGLARDIPATDVEWVECLHNLHFAEGNVSFWLGDHMVHGENRWGGVSVQQMVEATTYDYKTLAKYAWVARQIDPSRRRLDLRFSHHEAVAGLPVDQQEFILTRSENEGWTSKEVRAQVQRLACETERPPGPSLLSGLHYGDCREVLSVLPDESIDLLLTDPPADGRRHSLRLFEDVLRCAVTKLKPNSHLYVFTTWATYVERFALLEQCVDLRNCLLWVEHDGPTRAVHVASEYQVLFAHKGRRLLNGKREGDALYFALAPGHPVEKPVPLLQHFIERSTQPGEIVLDPFMALGSTCLAAHQAGRGYIGIEANRQWYEEAQRRLAPAVVA